MSLTYHITTFGCQMNTYETELMEGMFAARGWTPATDETHADIVFYNTCVVRDGAEQRAMARLRQLKALKRARPGVILGVTGCMAQKEADRLRETLPHLDLIIGTRAIPRLNPLLDEVLATGRPQTCVDTLDEAYPADVTPRRHNRLKALVTIILGCNKKCSYCIVPSVRGREVSRPLETVLTEVRALVDEGFKEITLVGQNVNSYRWQGMDFGGLLREVSAVAGDAWVRYITSHPRDCNDSHIAAVAECANVCENFHLPAQAGSSTVLRNMYRGYTRERYLALIDQVRSAVPDATLSTDLIVGFPGETDDEFNLTLDMVRRVRYDSAFMYMYSPRPGTPAAEQFEDHIPLETKKARLAELIRIQEAISLDVNQAAIGTTERVLVESVATRTEGDLLGRTRGDKMVVFPGPAEWVGRFMDVRIMDANSHTLFGRICPGESA